MVEKITNVFRKNEGKNRCSGCPHLDVDWCRKLGDNGFLLDICFGKIMNCQTKPVKRKAARRSKHRYDESYVKYLNEKEIALNYFFLNMCMFE